MEDLEKQEQAAPASEETSGEMEYIDTDGNKHRKKCDYERIG